jgi:hypothetical protein
MTQPVPETITSELNKQISGLIDAATDFMDVNSWAVRMLVSDAKKLIKVDPAEGHVALGKIYQLCGDVESMRHHLENAIKLKNDVDFFGVRSACESNLGFMTEASRHIAIVGEPTRGRLSRCCDIALGCGAVSLLNEYIDRAENMGIELSATETKDARIIGKVFSDAGITDEHVSAVLDIVGSIMRERKIFSVGGGSSNIEIEEGAIPTIFYNFSINLPGDQVADMSEELADRIARSPLPIYDQFFVSFRPA